MAGTWAILKEDARGPSILLTLAEIYRQMPLPPSTSVPLAITLSSVPGAKIGLNTVSIAEKALRESVDNTTPASYRLQLLVNASAGEIGRILQFFDKLLAAVKEYSSEVDQQSDGMVLGGFERDRSFGIIAPIIGTLAAAGRVSVAMELIVAWRGIRNVSIPPKVMIVLTNWHGGVSYCVDDEPAITNEANVTDTLLEMTEAGNEFFGTNLVIRDEVRFQPHDSARPGVPDANSQANKRFEKAIENHFRFQLAEDRIRDRNLAGFMPIPGMREPIQTSMLKTLGTTLPIATSCTEPSNDRSLRKVCIWLAGTLYGELEQNWLKEIFGRRNMELVLPKSRTSEDFKAVYSIPDLDLLWIIGHGRFDPYYHEKLSIDLSEDEVLDLVEWAGFDLPQIEGRRLIVANLCDSGTIAVLGGTGEIGLPGILPRNAQALIAHLWPVSSMHAGIFGAVLAIQLCESPSFFQAYANAVRILISGKEKIENELIREFGEPHEVIERLHGAADNWRDIFVWGSPGFFA